MDRNEEQRVRVHIGEHLDVPDTRLTDDIGIRQDHAYPDDDGQIGESSSDIRDARGVLNWFKDRR